MKIGKWIERLDIIYFFTIALVMFVVISQSNIDPLNKSLITVICIPIYLKFFEKIIEYKLQSRDVEIDIYGTDAVENSIVWKKNSEKSYSHYIVISNTSNVLVEKILGKVKKENNSGEYLFEVNAHINPKDKVVVEIPFCYEDIESVWISGYLKYEKITKQFYGDISEHEGQYIWAENKYHFGEWNCLIHKVKRTDEFVKLKKYWS